MQQYIDNGRIPKDCGPSREHGGTPVPERNRSSGKPRTRERNGRRRRAQKRLEQGGDAPIRLPSQQKLAKADATRRDRSKAQQA